MSILSRFAKKAPVREDAAEVAVECPHWELAPRWDNASDMGDKDKVTSYACTNCQKSFSPDEARSFSTV